MGNRTSNTAIETGDCLSYLRMHGFTNDGVRFHKRGFFDV